MLEWAQTHIESAAVTTAAVRTRPSLAADAAAEMSAEVHNAFSRGKNEAVDWRYNGRVHVSDAQATELNKIFCGHASVSVDIPCKHSVVVTLDIVGDMCVKP